MFGHVGRRTQNLVGRQIALIDQLEREETDPGRLQHLYRLDHVSSRLSRNAGSLVVLSGSTGANEHVNPLPLTDVVRLALGEIEDYVRVDVQVPSELALVPNVINDIVLVLAELMENATVFSPPQTRITVAAQAAAYGAQISIIDHGIGLRAERLAEENARLARRERLDLAPTEVLGVLVGWPAGTGWASPCGRPRVAASPPRSRSVTGCSRRRRPPCHRSSRPACRRPTPPRARPYWRPTPGCHWHSARCRSTSRR
jgi:hypothetical protein